MGDPRTELDIQRDKMVDAGLKARRLNNAVWTERSLTAGRWYELELRWAEFLDDLAAALARRPRPALERAWQILDRAIF